ncbi:MAG: molecular chaperone TorD family protein [Halodesulfurarchaeum sp.]|nr:molecular chaperone TorD family protein [Halodesulfurarchaeum sp.]
MSTINGDDGVRIEDREAVALGTVYGVLANLYEEPSREVYDRLRDGSLFAELDGIIDRANLDVSVPTVETEDDYDLLCARFNDLFAVGYPDPVVPRYESEHVDRSWTDVNLDLARAYEYFDVEIDETEREHHDYLPLELEFVGYLSRLAATGETDARRARADFLDRHLEPFLASMEETVADEPETGIYANVIDFTERFVRADRDRLTSQMTVNAE